MNRTAKLVIVSALVVAVAAVVIGKQRAKTAPDSSGTSTTTTGPAASTDSALTTPLPRLVDVGSTTCIPCQMMAPILSSLRTEYAGSLQVDFCDVQVDTGAVERYAIAVIPTQIFFAPSGKELWRHEGYISEDEILAKWKELGFGLEKGASGAETR